MKRNVLPGSVSFDQKAKTEPSKRSPFLRISSLVLAVAMFNLTIGCRYFKVTQSTTPVSQSIPDLAGNAKRFVLHVGNEAWVVPSPQISDNELICYVAQPYSSVLEHPVNPNRPNRYKPIQSGVLNEVHIYASEATKQHENRFVIPTSAVEKVEIYEKDKASTTGSYILGGLGIAALAFGGTMLLVALLKESCPFIYDMNGEEPHFIGEIYSGSVQPALERNDYLKMSSNWEGNEFNLKISNEAKEIQHTNLLEIWKFENVPGTDIFIDKYGKYHTVSTLTSPQNAVSLRGENVTSIVSEKNDLFYTTRDLSRELPLTDGIVLEFPNPGTADRAKLVIRAKNSFLLDYAMGQFHDLFGDLHSKWVKKQRKAPKEKLMQWSRDQNIPLTLSVERNGEWEVEDFYNIAGPMAFKDDILSFQLKGTESNPLKVKLEAGNFLWEIDYVAIDYSADLELEYQVVPVHSAISDLQKDVSKFLQKDDNKYYNQVNIGDEALVHFQFPESTSEQSTLYLHSKGWYEILRDPQGTPDREYLETFREPGRFNRFVNEFVQSMASR